MFTWAVGQRTRAAFDRPAAHGDVASRDHHAPSQADRESQKEAEVGSSPAPVPGTAGGHDNAAAGGIRRADGWECSDPKHESSLLVVTVPSADVPAATGSLLFVPLAFDPHWRCLSPPPNVVRTAPGHSCAGRGHQALQDKVTWESRLRFNEQQHAITGRGARRRNGTRRSGRCS